MGAKILDYMVYFYLCIFFMHFFENTVTQISNWVANYIPTIDKLIKQPTAIARLPANYFSVLICLIPFLALWMVWGEDVLSRCRHGNQRLVRGRVETFVLVYIFFVPALMLIIYMAYVAPFDFPDHPISFGQRAFHLMLNAQVGLLVLGSFAGVIVSQMVVFLLWLFWLPVAYFFFDSKKG